MSAPMTLPSLLLAGFRRAWIAMLAAWAMSPAFSQPPPAGVDLYKRHCAVCHGDQGDGQSLTRSALQTPPRDFTTEEARQVLTREYMIVIVRDGRPGTPMQGRKTRLEQPQIEAVVDFIRTAFMRAEPGTPRARGREVYMATCAACHGARGQGGRDPAHRGKEVPPLRDGGGTADALREVLRAALARPGHGAVGNDLAGQLGAADTAAVADYVAGALFEPLRASRAVAPGR